MSDALHTPKDGSETPKRRESVAQKHPMACGLACTAYLTGQDYDLLASQQHVEKLHWWGFYCSDLVEILGKYGQDYGWKKLEEHERDGDVAVDSMVFVEPTEADPLGHFLVRTEDCWMDPWINYDVYEVLEAILALKNLSRDDIANIQDQKRQKRGSFEKRLLMLKKV